MFMTKIKRVIVSGYRNFMRSGFTSLASIIIMTVTLFVITSLIFIQAALNSSLNDIKEKVDVTVYFVTNTDDSTIKNIQTSLENLPEVQNVTYISQDQALADFKDRHSNDYLTLQALDELDQNPLGEKETGARAALPIWITFMKAAIAGKEGERFPGQESAPAVERALRTSGAPNVAAPVIAAPVKQTQPASVRPVAKAGPGPATKP